MNNAPEPENMRFSARVPLDFDLNDPMSCFTYMKGTMSVLDETDCSIDAGFIRGNLINFGHHHPLEVLDIVDDELANLATFFNKNGDLHEPIRDLVFGTGGHHDSIDQLIVLQRLYINPKFRGFGFAKTIIDQTLKFFNDKIEVALLIADPQKEETDEMGDLSQFKNITREQGVDKLISHYSTMGFLALPNNSNFMIKSVPTY